jgi:parvulin-like peptidyl-prolyl isomerase
MMRLERLGLAEELYLRLLDDGASFGNLAETHALGDERHTRGIVGPMPLEQPHPRIRQALARLAPGELHPPFQVDTAVLVLRLERRLPARLEEPMRQQLLRELLEQDLEASTTFLLDELRRRPGPFEAVRPGDSSAAEVRPLAAAAAGAA